MWRLLCRPHPACSFSFSFPSSLLLRRTSTIFALSSGQGRCGVAVIRISGPRAEETVRAMTPKKAAFPTPRVATLRTLRHPETGEALDRGIVLWFPGPGSFTGEDCAELHVHGSPAVVSALATAMGAMEGLRPAGPGEFARRALVAGKMDLAQAEGLGDLIHAETEQQRKQALRQMDGDLSKQQRRWRSELLRLVAHTEAYIDFSESDELEPGVLEQVGDGARGLLSEFDRSLSSARAGERLRVGVRVAVVGAPNAGKSSLLNLLAGRDAAIVSPLAGTTRDAVEAALDVGGFPVVAVDTAGLRRGRGRGRGRGLLHPVEEEGIARAVKNANGADLVIFVVDAAQVDEATLADRDRLFSCVVESCREYGLNEECLEKLLVFANKIDLVSERPADDDGRDGRVCFLSCVEDGAADAAVSRLRDELERLCLASAGGGGGGGGAALTRARHAAHLRAARAHLARYLEAREADGQDGDLALAAEELRLAAREVGRIVGEEVAAEQILDAIFADFCIGK